MVIVMDEAARPTLDTEYLYQTELWKTLICQSVRSLPLPTPMLFPGGGPIVPAYFPPKIAEESEPLFAENVNNLL